MFLSSVANGVDYGYVAYLRLLRELKETQVALKASNMSSTITHERIGHLNSPYLYHLTQQLGAVFASIGLPEEYEESRNKSAEQLLKAAGRTS